MLKFNLSEMQVGDRTVQVHTLPRGSRTYRAWCSECGPLSNTAHSSPLKALLEARHTCH